jgi:hypothetical protein
MRDLIVQLQEASGPERLTRMPHTCPHGWTQEKVKQGRKIFFTCKPPSAMDLARQGASPATMAWEAVKKYNIRRAQEALNIGKYSRAEDKIRMEILDVLEDEDDDGDEGLKQGKKWLLKTLKPLFAKLGVDVGGSRGRSRKRSR